MIAECGFPQSIKIILRCESIESQWVVRRASAVNMFIGLEIVSWSGRLAAVLITSTSHHSESRLWRWCWVLSRVRSLHTSEVIGGVSAVFTSHCVSPPSLPPLPLPTWHCAYCRGNVNVYIFTLSILGCLIRDLMDYLLVLNKWVVDYKNKSKQNRNSFLK